MPKVSALKQPSPQREDPKRAAFKRVAGLRVANVLQALNVLGQLAENSSRYISYERDYVEIEAAIQAELDKIMVAFRRGSRRPTFEFRDP